MRVLCRECESCKCVVKLWKLELLLWKVFRSMFLVTTKVEVFLKLPQLLLLLDFFVKIRGSSLKKFFNFLCTIYFKRINKFYFLKLNFYSIVKISNYYSRFLLVHIKGSFGINTFSMFAPITLFVLRTSLSK